MRRIRRNPPVSSHSCRYWTAIREPVLITSVTYCSSLFLKKNRFGHWSWFRCKHTCISSTRLKHKWPFLNNLYLLFQFSIKKQKKLFFNIVELSLLVDHLLTSYASLELGSVILQTGYKPRWNWLLKTMLLLSSCLICSSLTPLFTS